MYILTNMLTMYYVYTLGIVSIERVSVGESIFRVFGVSYFRPCIR